MKRLFSLIAVNVLLSAMPMQAAVEGPAARALAILIDELQREGFDQITVSPRIFGGYVVEAHNGDEALLVALDPQDFTPQLTELFEADDQSGFFGNVQPPLDQASQAVVARYTTRLATSLDQGPATDVSVFLRGADADPITAGFTQNRSISSNDETVVIRQNETLGMLTPVTTTITTSTDQTTGEVDRTSNVIEQRMTFSTEQSSQTVRMTGTDAFNSEIFTAPDSVRNSIIDSVNMPSTGAAINQAGLIDQIATTTETLSRNMPNGLPEGFPTNIRENTRAVLTPPAGAVNGGSAQ